MIRILQFQGTDAELYSLVAPLVMNPKILKYNNNYPFKTNDSFVWFVAVEEKEVKGFVPVEVKGSTMTVNNYYVDENEENTLFPLLLKTVIGKQAELEKSLHAVVMVRHAVYFESEGFKTCKVWTKYLKMER